MVTRLQQKRLNAGSGRCETVSKLSELISVQLGKKGRGKAEGRTPRALSSLFSQNRAVHTAHHTLLTRNQL
jgi:hypothetical protein